MAIIILSLAPTGVCIEKTADICYTIIAVKLHEDVQQSNTYVHDTIITTYISIGIL